MNRILIDARGNGRGGTGIAHYVRSLISALAALDFQEGRVLCWRSERRLIGDLGLRPWPLPSGRFFRPWLLPPVRLTHGPAFRALAVRSARQVITIHDLSFLHYPGDYPPGLVEELSAVLDRQQRTVDLAICISATTESDLLDRFRGFEGRTTVIHHGVGKEWFVSADEARIRKTLATLGIEPPYLLHIGALVPRKDLPTLVRAWMLLNERGHALALVLAGPDAVGWKSDLNAIRAVARDSAGPEPLHILGYVDDLAARHLMAAAAVYVCTSKCEGFGLPVLEAMAAGRPVVATRLSAVKEVAGDAIAYADVGDAEGLAAVIERVLRAPESGSEERARARASRFTWQRCAQQTLASYQHLLAS